MKMFKRVLSCFMAVVMALTIMCGLTVNVGAVTQMTSRMYVNAENSGDGYYFIYLKGISNEDFMAAGKRVIENKDIWYAEIQFYSSDGKFGDLMSFCYTYEEGTNQIYQYIPACAYYNGKSVNLDGAFAFYDIEIDDSDYSYTRSWTVYFSVPEDIYVAFWQATKEPTRMVQEQRILMFRINLLRLRLRLQIQRKSPPSIFLQSPTSPTQVRR